MQQESKQTIFICHSSKDREIVDVIVSFLINAFNINQEIIYCTSSRITNKPMVGQNFIEDIWENIKDAKRVFCLISESFLKSQFCLCELGAAWAFKSHIIPIIIPPLTLKILDSTPLKSLNAITLEDWNQIYKDLYTAGIIQDQFAITAYPVIEQHFNKVRNKLYEDSLSNLRYEVYTFGFNKPVVFLHTVIKEIGVCRKVVVNLKNKKQIDKKAFCSCVIHFFPFKDWSQKITNDTLYLRIMSSNIKFITLELKCTNRNIIVHQQNISLVENDWLPISVPLHPIRSQWSEYLTEVSEICLVVKSQNVVGTHGEFYLSNVSLCD